MGWHEISGQGFVKNTASVLKMTGETPAVRSDIDINIDIGQLISSNRSIETPKKKTGPSMITFVKFCLI